MRLDCAGHRAALGVHDDSLFVQTLDHRAAELPAACTACSARCGSGIDGETAALQLSGLPALAAPLPERRTDRAPAGTAARAAGNRITPPAQAPGRSPAERSGPGPGP